MKYPLNHPDMDAFTKNVDRINALADESEGFIWRYQTEAGNALDTRLFSDETLLFNMSVWLSIKDLQNYVYRSLHVEFLKSKKKWFDKILEQHMVLWWIPRAHRPAVEEARYKLDLLQMNGPGPEAFSFARPFPPGSQEGIRRPS